MHQNQNKYKNTNTKKYSAVTSIPMDEAEHIPVMLEEVLTILDPKPGQRYLDVTAGYGGHASRILERTLHFRGTVLVDRDESAVDHLRTKFRGSGIQILHNNYLDAAKDLLEQERTFDMVLADLGVSSPHLNQASRGFSFMSEAPLDMRMDQSQELTAEDIVNTYNEAELEEILKTYGEEPKAAQIARKLVENRPISSTTQLANLIAQVWPGQKSKKHPATRTFQALRIAVNDELELLQKVLPYLTRLLAPGGRLAIITFHSLEDRIVKQFFAERTGNRYDAELKVLTKKPITPEINEIVSNPRARSAKLRAVAK